MHHHVGIARVADKVVTMERIEPIMKPIVHPRAGATGHFCNIVSLSNGTKMEKINVNRNTQ